MPKIICNLHTTYIQHIVRHSCLMFIEPNIHIFIHAYLHPSSQSTVNPTQSNQLHPSIHPSIHAIRTCIHTCMSTYSHTSMHAYLHTCTNMYSAQTCFTSTHAPTLQPCYFRNHSECNALHVLAMWGCSLVMGWKWVICTDEITTDRTRLTGRTARHLQAAGNAKG